MASEWKITSLKEAGVQLLDCDHRTPVPVQEGYPYIAIPQMKGGRLDFAEARRISTDDFIDWTKKTLPQKGDIVLSRRCNPGETAYVGDNTQFALGQNLVLLRADERRVLPEFLRWAVRGVEWWMEIQKYLNVGAVFDSLRCNDIPSFRMLVPPIEQQWAIAHILGTLDDKIELNRKMNETLEAMARALFQSWFVDFDPVRAKAEGRPTGLPDSIAALFPDSFQNSELGPIPTGWTVGRLDDLFVLQRGFDLPTPNRIPGNFPVVAASGPSGTHNQFTVRGPGVTTGRSGVLGKVFFVHEDFWPLNTSLWIKEFKQSRPAYAFYLLRLLNFELFNAGSAVPTLNRNHVHGLPMLLPSMELIDKFEFHAFGMLKRQRANDVESSTLACVRDGLLPKLISGEIRVKEAAQLVEAAL
ncbi:MAG: restriction endonuclease subunit S [Acidobacteriaceae bacterium]